MQPATADETEIFAKLLKLIELAPQQQTGPGPDAIEPDEPTKPGAPTASTTPCTQAPSSSSASPAPEAVPPSAPKPTPPQPAGQSDPAPVSVIARCIKAHNKARSEAIADGQPRFTVDEAGAQAYRNAMPPLLGAENIRDFIACVGQGMLFGVIDNRDATKLLYAAQVAFSAQNRSAESRTKLKPGPKPAAEVSPSSLGNN